MAVTYRDEIGIVQVKVDEYGVAFSDGFAYFGDGENDYKIETKNIIEIVSI